MLKKRAKGITEKKAFYILLCRRIERERQEWTELGRREREKKLTIQRPKQWKGKVLYFNKKKEREKCGNECDIYGQLGRG